MSTGINVTKPIKILDEGVLLTSDLSQIDFTGGVTATTVGNNVTVNVPAAGITVGTTPVTSGTDGRVFFQAGGVVQQDAAFFWDNTNKRLGVGATPSSSVRLDVRAQGALSTDIAFRVRNSADTLNTFQSTGDGKTKMQGSIYYTEFDPANGLYVGNNFGNMINLSGVLQGTSWFNAGADGKLAVGRGTANYRFHVNSSTTNSNIPACFNNENNDVNGQNGIAFTTTWTGSAFGNIGGILYMKHTYLGGNNASQNCQFNFDLNYNNSAPTTRASITGRSNVLIGTPTENTADSHTIYIQNGTAPTVALAGGGKLYVEDGALKFIGSSGTITNVGGSVQAVVSAATVTPVYTNKFVKITAQAAALTLANPTGTWAEGQDLMIRIKDDGTARAITWDTNYRAIGVTLPTTTVINKTTYVGIIYNSTDGKWDAIGVTTEA